MRLERFAFLGLTLVVMSMPGLVRAYEQEVKALSAKLAESIAASGKKTVAVVDFTDLQGNVTELGRFLAEELSIALSGDARDFRVVDRTHLKTILREHKLASTGIIDPQTAKRLGEIAGVDALVTGSITPFGDSVRLSVKVLDVSTAQMIGASSANIPKTKAVEELLARGIGSAVRPTVTGSSGGALPQPTTSPPVAPTFETESYKVTVESMRRTASSIALTLVFESLSDRKTRLSWNGNATYLLDENGERWDLDGRDSAGVVWRPGHGPATLLPGTKIKTRLLFLPRGQATGTRFTLASSEGQPRNDRQVLIRDIR